MRRSEIENTVYLMLELQFFIRSVRSVAQWVVQLLDFNSRLHPEQRSCRTFTIRPERIKVLPHLEAYLTLDLLKL